MWLSAFGSWQLAGSPEQTRQLAAVMESLSNPPHNWSANHSKLKANIQPTHAYALNAFCPRPLLPALLAPLPPQQKGFRNHLPHPGWAIQQLPPRYPSPPCPPSRHLLSLNANPRTPPYPPSPSPPPPPPHPLLARRDPAAALQNQLPLSLYHVVFGAVDIFSDIMGIYSTVRILKVGILLMSH